MSTFEAETHEIQPQLPLLSRLLRSSHVAGILAVSKPATWFVDWYRYFVPPGDAPDATKSYDTRSWLPISIFFPKSYTDSSSSKELPTLFTIHGGGFTIGTPADDQNWNRTFANTHEVLVIALNYSKAPFYPYPTAIHDLEALISAALADASLPIDKQRCAIGGFSAGGNLSLAVAQSRSLEAEFEKYGSAGFKAVIPVYGGLDKTISRDFKATQRHYKPDLTPNRNSTTDILVTAGKAFDWSYIPVGTNLKDPTVSPIFASRDVLPPYVFVIACELDLSSHDAWRLASRLAQREIPSMDVKVGRRECGQTGELELQDERFAWQVKGDGTGIRWLLVPDVIHGFDRMPAWMLGSETSAKDAADKKLKVIQEIGDWLKAQAWA